MPAVLAQSQALGAEKLRWGKYSAAYRGCLLEGIRCFERYLAEAGVGLDALSKQKPRVVDEVLEQFVKTMHEQGNKSSLRIAKQVVLTMQVYRPRLRRELPATWKAIKAWEEMKPSHFRAPVLWLC